MQPAGPLHAGTVVIVTGALSVVKEVSQNSGQGGATTGSTSSARNGGWYGTSSRDDSSSGGHGDWYGGSR